MNYEDFGVIIEDPFAEHDPEGVDIWLKLLCEAHRESLDFYAVLHYLRCTGTLLVPDDKFKYTLQPVVADYAWQSVEEYNNEKKYLQKWTKQLVEILKEL